MTFLSKESNGKKMIDKVFEAALRAKKSKKKHGNKVINATLGTLYDEEGILVSFDSVWEEFDKIDSVDKASYAASIQGNPDYLEAVNSWLFGNEKMNSEVIATPGGAGAVSATVKNILDPGQTLIKPSLGWGPYSTIANENNLKLTSYNLFKNNMFDLEDFEKTIKTVLDKEGKALAIINDPCHNPSGYTLSKEEWDKVIEIVNRLSENGPIILLHDIAYIDFSMDQNWNNTLLKLRDLEDNVMAVIAFSLSKTLSAYGMRVGAAVAVTNKNKELEKFKDAMIYTARSTWSTVNNGGMKLFSKINSDPEILNKYKREKLDYILLLKERADIFISEAREVGLDLFPYKEGYFATIDVKNDKLRKALYEKLENEYIFTVDVGTGLRVALCSVEKEKLKGLAKRINDLLLSL
ncbi:MAG: aminotransferase class I/II-fold pyridoxal phosphate-dependent enzyme [Candidatus Izimaplasma sp.]|nr:aminotransferase class I/II-fold pyridoxal phosphate-dependent enzyme [Candidatus Izimaplasma bacterium]